MKKSLFIILIFLSLCVIRCGDTNSPSGLEGVTVNMNDGSTIVVVNNVDKLIVGFWEATEFNANDGNGWMDISVIGYDFEIDFYADKSAEVYYLDEYYDATWSSSGNTVTLSIMGTNWTITSVTSTGFLLAIAEGTQRKDYRFEVW